MLDYKPMKTKIFIFSILISLLFAGFGAQAVHAADEPPDPRIAIYVIPPIADEKILPTTAIPDGYISNEISIVASPGEYEPASFVIHALDDIASLQVTATELEGESDSISSSNVDIRVVNCWYQAGVEVWDVDNKLLTPELLVKDDSLVKVEEGENYLKLTTGEYLWISDPTLVEDVYRPRTIEEIPVQDSISLQSVDIPNGTNKQFWITVNIPDDALPGIYTGNIELGTPDGVIGQLQLSLEVLPIELAPPYLIYSIYYIGQRSPWWPQGSISHEPKSEQQLRAEMRNLLEHGVTNPAIYQPYPGDPSSNYAPDELLREFLTIRDEMGMGGQPLYFLGLKPEGYQPIDKVAEVIAIAQSYGIPEVYFSGVDEALCLKGGTVEEAIERLTAQRPSWEAIRAAGGKIFVCGAREGHYPGDRSPGNFGFMGDIQDLLICSGEPYAEEAARWHSIGHQIFSYGNPQVGVENPETYRRNYGLLLWQADYDGAMDFAYQYGFGNIWNDFDNAEYRDHVFSYPTIDGVIDTIQWEGWREGVDDIRYLTTLLEVIEVGKAEGRDTSAAEDWLADLKSSDLTTRNLDDVRSEMIDHILSLQNQSQNRPPVLNPIGDKAVNEGELLSFTTSATDPDSDSLTYSASNLPQGASFSPSTRTFSWTPDQVGTYAGVHFEVSDGSLTDSEDITITVPLPLPPSSGGGGFVLLLPPPKPPGVTDVSNIMRSDGIFTEKATVQSDDGKCVLTIQKDTKGLTRNGEALSQISTVKMEVPPTPPEQSNIIGLVYDLGPDGATFDPAITITFTYDESLIPEGVNEKNAVIAIWDNESGRWIEMASVVDPDANTIMAKVSHFSAYTILTRIRPAAFTPSNLSITPAEVYTSETVNGSALITNIGDLTGSYEVTLRIDGIVIGTKEVIVGGGSSQMVNFSITQIYSPGMYAVDINGMTGTFEVKAPPAATFTTSDLTISPKAVYLGDTVTISTLITNTGNATGTHKVMLKIDGITEATKEVTIDASATQIISFTITKNNVGTYTVDANGMTGSFTVSEQLPPEISVFVVTPYYADETHKLIFAEMIYEVNNLHKPTVDAELVVDVSLDAKPAEEVSLLSTSQMESGTTFGSRDYIPPGIWETGTYTFQAKLYVDGESYTSMIEEKLEVTAESAIKVVNWVTLGMIISATLIPIVVTVLVVLYRRRYNML